MLEKLTQARKQSYSNVSICLSTMVFKQQLLSEKHLSPMYWLSVIFQSSWILRAVVWQRLWNIFRIANLPYCKFAVQHVTNYENYFRQSVISNIATTVLFNCTTADSRQIVHLDVIRSTDHQFEIWKHSRNDFVSGDRLHRNGGRTIKVLTSICILRTRHARAGETIFPSCNKSLHLVQ